MSLCWDNCRLIFCLFDRDTSQFPFYAQSTVFNVFFVTQMLIEFGLYPRWKVRVYIEDCRFSDVRYVSSWKQINKCDAETIPISLPTSRCNKYWFTSLRFILPILDTNLHAFRLLDVHYLWTRTDVKWIVQAVENWSSNCWRPFSCFRRLTNHPTSVSPKNPAVRIILRKHGKGIIHKIISGVGTTTL